MYYIVETKEQLDKLLSKQIDNIYLEIICQHDHYHDILNSPSLFYIKNLKDETGYIIPVNHSESLNISMYDVTNFINCNCNKILTLDKKKLLYYNINFDKIYDINIFLFFNHSIYINHEKYNTLTHKYFYNKHSNFREINKIIPISKHYEKFENIFQVINKYSYNFDEEYYKFYNNIAIKVFFNIERKGIGIDINYSNDLTNKNRFIDDGIIYTHYNLLNKTGRPSCNFNGINFMALKKNSDDRKMLIPKNDIFLELDFKAYQIRLIGELIDYDNFEDDIYEYFGKIYFNKDNINDQESEKSKSLTFKYIYGFDIPDHLKNVSFFNKIIQYKEKCVEFFKENSYILSPIYKRPIRKIDSDHKILPYLLQCFETERNILKMNMVQEYLKNKKTNISLYGYDSILFDVSKEDGVEWIDDIISILSDDKYPLHVKKGINYNDLIKI